MNSIYNRANRLARKKAEEISDSYLAIIQTGSSLRKADFTPDSDVDLYGIREHEPEHLFCHSSQEDVDISIIHKSLSEFERDLEQGCPFELVALKYGRVLSGEKFFQRYRGRDYGPGRRTYLTWIRSALNHYHNMIFDRNMPAEFYNSAYHSCREFSRYLILDRFNKIVEGDSMIRDNLDEISSEFAESFWGLRQTRFDSSPHSRDYLEVKELLREKEYNSIRKVDKIGKEVFEQEELIFPTLAKINELLQERGLEILLAPYYSLREEQKVAFISGGSEDGDHKSFQYDIETGELEELHRMDEGE